MADWLIRVIGKERKEIDKDLLVQAVLALGRQLWSQQQPTTIPLAPTLPAAAPEPQNGRSSS